MTEDIQIYPQFARALEILEEGKKSLFITGKAGVGKSTLLEYFCRRKKPKPVVLAPTGVAALNVKGQTIHSFFNFYIDVTPEKIAKKKIKPRSTKLYKNLTTIIIDEISMVRADLFDCIDEFLRLYGPKPGERFGGVQMVLVGDLYQLPPVVNAEEMPIFLSQYASPYFFSAKAFSGYPIEVLELDKVYRQKDQTFVDLLNRIRNNSMGPNDIMRLNSRYMPDFRSGDGEFYISLTTTNKRADEINEGCLKELDGKLYSYKAVLEGNFAKEYYPTALDLQFKVGSQVMMLNNDAKKRWVNGSVGKISSIKKVGGEDVVSVLLQDSRSVVNVTRFQWEVFRFSLDEQGLRSDPVGTFTQFPFRLAWAVTIHKSQGKTFERVIIDLGRGTFASGQMYVAISRCASFDGVVFKTPIRPHHINVDPRINKFLTSAHSAPLV